MPRKQLKSHFCTDEDLGLTRTQNTVMFPLNKNHEFELETYRNKFRCVDRDELQIWGDFNSAQAQQLIVRFKMC